MESFKRWSNTTLIEFKRARVIMMKNSVMSALSKRGENKNIVLIAKAKKIF